MKSTTLLTVGLLLAASAFAQDCPRPTTQLTLNGPATPFFPPGTTITSPKQADFANLCYAVWVDVDTVSGNDSVRFLRSNDGGFTWDPSSSQELWVAQPGEGNIPGDLQVVAEGDLVYVVMLAVRDVNGMASSNSDESVWVLGSNDQGATFQQLCISPGTTNALPSGEDLGDCDAIVAAISGGRCHVAFESDLDLATGGVLPVTDFNELIVYQAAEFNGVGSLVTAFPNERILTSFADGTFDVDDPAIDADATIVTIAWHDDSPFALGGDDDNTVSRTSIDGGFLFGPEVVHSQLSFEPNEEPGIVVAITGTSIAVASVDARDPMGPSTGTDQDRVYVNVSQDIGFTWTDNLAVGAGTDDISSEFPVSIQMAATANGFVIAAVDSRSGFDQVTTIVDRANGSDFINGTWVESDPVAANRGTESPEGIAMDSFGEVVVCSSRFTPGGGGQGLQASWSTDGGLTWDDCIVAPGGAAGDVVGSDIAIGPNYDINVIWPGDVVGPTDVFVSGLKLGRLVDLTSTGGGVVYEGLPSDAGNSIFFAFSLTPPVSNALPIPGLPGAALNFVPDGLTTEVGLLPGAFTTVGPDGTAVYPLANTLSIFSTLFGPFYYIGIPGDANGVFRTFTDPLEQN